ncbi:MAG: vitamin K epoxide reductase family protein [Enhygromyxa sp.]
MNLPADSAATVLFELARIRGVRSSRARVRALVQQHPDAGSLLALCDAAAMLGMTLEAGQASEVEALFEIATPALLFFDNGEQRGFGILEAAGAERVRIRDAVHGVRELSPEQLATLWTGVVVEVSDGPEPAQPEPGWRWRRAEELLLEQWRVPVDLVGPGASPRARTITAVFGALLLLACVLVTPNELRAVAAVLAILATLGLAACWTMHRRVTGTDEGGVLCGSGGVLDCDSVLLSPWARPAGVPLSDLGVGLFSGWLAVLGIGALSGSSAAAWIVGLQAMLGVVAGLILSLVSALRLRTLCPLCMVVHLVALAAVLVFVLGVAPAGPPPLDALLIHGALDLAVVWIGVGVIMPGFTAGARLDWTLARMSELGRSPLATLGAWLRRPADGPDPETLGVWIGPRDAARTLLILAHPMCDKCGALLREAELLLRSHARSLALVLVVPPLDADDPRDHALCTRLTAIGLAHGGEAMLAALFLAKAQAQRLLDGDHQALTDALELDAGAVEAQLERGRVLVDRALRAKTEHAEGIPTLFLDRRRYDGRLTHLHWLLEHPKVLDAAIQAQA